MAEIGKAGSDAVSPALAGVTVGTGEIGPKSAPGGEAHQAMVGASNLTVASDEAPRPAQEMMYYAAGEPQRLSGKALTEALTSALAKLPGPDAADVPPALTGLTEVLREAKGERDLLAAYQSLLKKG